MTGIARLLNIMLFAFLRDQYFFLACGALLSIVSTIIIIRVIHGAWLVAWDARKSAEQGE